jgi:phosphate transport system permease protein
VAQGLGYVVDLLAAIPSIVYGFWGIAWLAPRLVPFYRWLDEHVSWLPFFAGPASATGKTMLTAGIVLAIMILPIITATTQEVFRQTPRFQIEAAQALGATRWEVVRMAVLPYGRSGFIAASMLGLGRALGETIAILLVIRASTTPSHGSLFDGGYTFASLIASAASEFSQPLPTGAYIAAGLVLFVLTFVVNALARVVAGGKVNG